MRNRLHFNRNVGARQVNVRTLAKIHSIRRFTETAAGGLDRADFAAVRAGAGSWSYRPKLERLPAVETGRESASASHHERP